MWSVIVFIGFFGCGKFMFLCMFNCMYEVIFGVCVEGEVLFDGKDFYGFGVDLVFVCC